MAQRPYFRFSLRSLLIVVAVAALASLWYRSHLAFRRSVFKEGLGGGYRIAGDPQHLRSRIYCDHDNRLIAILLLAFDELDASGPRYELKRGYNTRQGGWLILDGVPVTPGARPQLFVNDPSGQIVRLNLSANQMEDLAARRSAAEIEFFYRETIEPLLVKAEGKSDAKGRQGLWSFRLSSGQLVKEVAYVDGLRHGPSTTYYAQGGKRCQASFRRGKPEGQWTLLDPDGDVLAIFDRDGVISSRSGGPILTWNELSAVPKSDRHARRWESRIDDTHGYRLFVDGAEMRIPP